MMISFSASAAPKELPLPIVPDTIRVPADRADYVMRHFWDAMNFSDTTLTHDRIWMEQNLVNYLSLFPHGHQKNLQDIVNAFLDKANIDRDTYSSIYDLAGTYLNSSDSPMRNEEFYILFLNHAVKEGNLDDAEHGRAKFRLEMAMKNRPGTPAPDFKVLTREGNETNLYALLKEGNNVVLFYDPDCNHCAETIQYLSDSPVFKDVNVIAIDSEEDHILWDMTEDQLPTSWTVGFALDPIQESEQYVFPEMPTIYLLDDKGIVLMKEATVENLLKRLQ